MEEAYYNAEQKLLVQPKGYAVVRAKYDDRGNVVEAAFYGADDRLLPQPEGYARVTGTYGDEGRLVNEAFFDAEDRPAHTNQNYATPFGYSQMRNEYTADGRLTAKHLSGFEPHWGYAEMVVSFDEQSNPVRTSHLDAEGRSVETEVLVTLVLSGSRAEKMGIRAGDVLLDYNGRPVLHFFRFIRERDAEPADGPASKLRIRRGEAILTFSIPPGKLGMGLQGRGIGRRSPGDVEVGARSAVPATPYPTQLAL